MVKTVVSIANELANVAVGRLPPRQRAPRKKRQGPATDFLRLIIS